MFAQKIHVIIFVCIVCTAAVLRLYKLDTSPPSPYWEEVALGYDAYSIARTGKDHHGNSYPLLAFPSYGDYKPSGYFYTIVPFIQLIGLNIWAIRLPSAVAGIVSVILVYLIGKELFDKKTGLIASALFAISPWAIQFSRGGWEVNVALMLTLAGAHCLITSRRKYWMLPFAVLFLCLSMYVYHAARLFAPLVGIAGGLIVLFTWFRQDKPKPVRSYLIPFILAAGIALGLTLPFIVNLRSETVSSRFSQTTVLTDLEPVLKSNAQIAKHGNTLITRLQYHRYWYYGQVILQSWASHFSPQFLFVRGDGNLRHFSGRFGLLYPLDAVFLVSAVCMAAFILFKKTKRSKTETASLIAVLCCIGWIGLAAVAPSLVKPSPHALRFLFAAPAFSLLTAVGISFLLSNTPKKMKGLVTIAIVVAYLYFVISLIHWLIAIYPSRAAKDWQYGYKQVYEVLESEKKEGERVYMTREEGRPAMYYLFFSSFDPEVLQETTYDFPKDQLELLQVHDYFFVDALPIVPGLFATSPVHVDPQGEILDTIRRPDGSTVWVVWRRE